MAGRGSGRSGGSVLGEVGVAEAAPRPPIAQLHGVAGASQLDGGVGVAALLPQHEAEHFLVGGSECGERRFQPAVELIEADGCDR